MCFTIPFSPFLSILRAPCVASKSVMALETLSPVAASYSACHFRSIEVDVVVQVCTGACSKENPRCKATLNLSSLKVGSEGHCMSIQTGRLHMHECLQCGNDSSWKHCVLFIDAEDKVGWDFAAYQAWSKSTTVFIIFHHLPATKILVKEMTPQTCFSVSVPKACCKKSCESQKLDWPNIPTKIQLFVAFSFAMAAASSECIPYLLLTRIIVDFSADPSLIVAKKFVFFSCHIHKNTIIAFRCTLDPKKFYSFHRDIFQNQGHNTSTLPNTLTALLFFGRSSFSACQCQSRAPENQLTASTWTISSQ